MDESILISPPEARRISGGISESTQRRLIDAGEYPRAVVLSRTGSGRPARVAFVRDEVLGWCRRRIESDRGLEPA